MGVGARLVIAFAILSACAPPITAASPAAAHSTPTTPPTARPVDAQLAFIDQARGGPNSTDVIVSNIRSQIDQIKQRCDIADGEVADYAVNGQNVLRGHSINERLPVILASWNQSLIDRPASVGGSKWTSKNCLEILTLWVIVRLGLP